LLAHFLDARRYRGFTFQTRRMSESFMFGSCLGVCCTIARIYGTEGIDRPHRRSGIHWKLGAVVTGLIVVRRSMRGMGCVDGTRGITCTACMIVSERMVWTAYPVCSSCMVHVAFTSSDRHERHARELDWRVTQRTPRELHNGKARGRRSGVTDDTTRTTATIRALGAFGIAGLSRLNVIAGS